MRTYSSLHWLCELLTLEAPGLFDQHNDPPDENYDQTDCKNYPQDGAEKAIGGNTEISHCWGFFCFIKTYTIFALYIFISRRLPCISRETADTTETQVMINI